MFYIFIRARKKYGFNFSLNTYGKDALTLRPNNTFEYINVKQGYYNRNYFTLFIKAIKIMREYRKKQVV